MIGWAEAFAKAREVDTSKMTLTQWLNMWGRLCYRSAGISDFPIWVQLLPSVFFDVMDKSCKFTFTLRIRKLHKRLFNRWLKWMDISEYISFRYVNR